MVGAAAGGRDRGLKAGRERPVRPRGGAASGLLNRVGQGGPIVVMAQLSFRARVTGAEEATAVAPAKETPAQANEPAARKAARRCPCFDEAGLRKLLPGNEPEVQVFGETSCLAQSGERVLVLSIVGAEDPARTIAAPSGSGCRTEPVDARGARGAGPARPGAERSPARPSAGPPGPCATIEPAKVATSPSADCDACREERAVKEVLLLVGPKGAGETTIGQLLATELGMRFLRVEPLFLQVPSELGPAHPDHGRHGFEAVALEAGAALEGCLRSRLLLHGRFQDAFVSSLIRPPAGPPA